MAGSQVGRRLAKRGEARKPPICPGHREPLACSPMPYHIFDTALGPCAIAWSEDGLTRVQLPDATHAKTEARMQRNRAVPASMPLPDLASEAVRSLQSYFMGEAAPLETLTLDETIVTAFNASIYRALRAVPRGMTVTYGELARHIGRPGAARAVGMAMGRNPWPVIVPCHRVLASGSSSSRAIASWARATRSAGSRRRAERRPRRSFWRTKVW